MIHSSKILTLKRYRTMAMNFVKKLPIPAEVKKMYPLSDRVVEIKKKRDAEIRDVFTGASDKFILIIGPCSADNVDSVLDYIHRLAKIQDKIGDRILLIPRIYTNKPRTTGEKATRVSSISRIRKRSRMYSQASSRCESSMQTPSSKPA